MTRSHRPLSLSEGGGVPDEGGWEPHDYIAYRKREQALFNQYHLDCPDTTDWDSPDSEEVYGKG